MNLMARRVTSTAAMRRREASTSQNHTLRFPSDPAILLAQIEY